MTTNRLKSACLLVAATLAAPAALAPVAQASEPQTGIYIGLGVGLGYQQDSKIDVPGTNANADFNLGFSGGGSIGYAFKNGIRVELEGSYRENEANSLSPSGVIPASANFNQRTNTGLLVNLVYDYHNSTGIIPSIGAGAGVSFTTSDELGDRAEFAFQGIAGLGYQLSDNVTAFVDYRFFGTPDINSRSFNSSISMSNFNHSVFAGVRFSLGNPFGDSSVKTTDASGLQPVARLAVANQLAAVQPRAAEAVTTSYLVFFETNRSLLSPKASQVVRTAAANLKRGMLTRINVTGHADRAGSAGHNVNLSRQRADVVRRVLLSAGVPASEILVMAKGEAQPLVPTPDGRPEAQNRRVEIVLN
jgi:outer membrane protein OmpA-like peptidoglycan-associated protein/opacity protein-like surface antigen